MHDHAPILDDRVHRHLAEKIRPAETTTVCHLNVEWAPVTDTVEGLNSRPGVVGQGEPISISAGLALAYEPFRIGDTWDRHGEQRGFTSPRLYRQSTATTTLR